MQGADGVFGLLGECCAGFQQQRVFFLVLECALPSVAALDRRVAVGAGDEALRDQGRADGVGGFNRRAVDPDIDDRQAGYIE